MAIMEQSIKVKVKRGRLIFVLCLILIVIAACGNPELNVDERLNNIFINDYSYGRFDSSIKKCKKLLEDVKKKEGVNSVDEVKVCNFLGFILTSIERYDEAEEYLLNAKKICEEIKLEDEIVGNVFFTLGQLELERKNYEQSIVYLTESIEWREKMLDVGADETGAAYLQIAHPYLEMGNLEEAEKYARKCLSFQYEPNHQNTVLSANMVLAEIKIRQEKYAEALNYTAAADQVFAKVYGNKREFDIIMIEYIYGRRAIAYSGLGDDENALLCSLKIYETDSQYLNEKVKSEKELLDKIKAMVFEYWKKVNESDDEKEFEEWLELQDIKD